VNAPASGPCSENQFQIESASSLVAGCSPVARQFVHALGVYDYDYDYDYDYHYEYEPGTKGLGNGGMEMGMGA